MPLYDVKVDGHFVKQIELPEGLFTWQIERERLMVAEAWGISSAGVRFSLIRE